MIIYCAGPIRGNTKYRNDFKEIILHIKSLGHTALSEVNEDFNSSIPLTEKQIFKRDIKWIEKSSLLIAEVSGASLGVGFEISYALYKEKMPVLALYNKDVESVSAMIAGCSSALLTVKKYSDSEQLRKIITEFINKSMVS
jgi:nucleoside 2-deoxyribosyltransferase